MGGFGHRLDLQTEVSGDFGDEVDFYGGLQEEIGGIRLDFSGSYFMLNHLGQTDDDQAVFDARVDFVRFPLITPYVASSYFGSVGDNSPQHGWFHWAGLSRNQNLGFRLPRQRENQLLKIDLQGRTPMAPSTESRALFTGD